MRAATATGAHGAELTPWLWAVNGATGVLASVLAIVVALGFGISVSYWCGVGAYTVAAAGWLWATRRL